MTDRLELTKGDRIKVAWRNQFLQGSWNYERMQNLGFLYGIIPALKKLYTKDDDVKAALKRHMEFYNTHPYPSAPVTGVTLALEEDRANGAEIDDTAINGVKVGMMGPLAGVGDPIFWGTLRPILGAFAASFAIQGNILGPILFFLLWNVIRMAFLWYTQEIAYKQGTALTKNLGGGLLGKLTEGASILGMFVMGILVSKWVSVGLYFPIQEDASVEGGWKTLQDTLDSLLPGLLQLVLLFAVIALIKKKVNPLVIIIGLFVAGIVIAAIYQFAWPDLTTVIPALKGFFDPGSQIDISSIQGG
jgi:PTS system mannose-specific IID component